MNLINHSKGDIVYFMDGSRIASGTVVNENTVYCNQLHKEIAKTKYDLYATIHELTNALIESFYANSYV